LADFSTTSAYYNRLKSPADQLSNVVALVSDQRLVLRLLAGLNEAYAGFVTVMQQKDNLPSFAITCSRLKLEETMIQERAARASSSTVLLTVDDGSSSQSQPYTTHNTPSLGRHNTNRGKRPTRGRGNNNRGGRGGRSGDGGASVGRGGAAHQHPQYQAYPPYPHPFFNHWDGWAHPPCSYPTTSWQPRPPRQTGILEQRPPQQAYNTSLAPLLVANTPTDINAAMHTLTLSPPDENWYMDTGATSHMTTDQGTLSSYFYSSKNHNIVVGNGH